MKLAYEMFLVVIKMAICLKAEKKKEKNENIVKMYFALMAATCDSNHRIAQMDKQKCHFV